MAEFQQAVLETELRDHLHLIARGKVRELYELDESTLLFVTTDRISGMQLPPVQYDKPAHILIAYDVVMKNVKSQSQINYFVY